MGRYYAWFEDCLRLGAKSIVAEIPSNLTMPDGGILQADIGYQANLTFRNLQRTLEKGNGKLDHAVQIELFLLDVIDMAPVDQAYHRYFREPFRNRANLVVAGLVAPEMRIELTVTVNLSEPV